MQLFIRQHESDDINRLVLAGGTIHDLPMTIIAEQIAGRKKAKEKIPTYYNTDGIIYPRGLNLEQCSSEQTGLFKSELAVSIVMDRERCLDLTGGFGVDSFFFSKVFREVYYVEPDVTLFEIAKHNHKELEANGILHMNTRAEDYLASTEQFFDLVYVDPSRRVSGGRKVFAFSDCEPDVTILQPVIFSKTNHLLVKSSPLLDIQQGLRSLAFVRRIVVVAVENECKELLFLCDKNFNGEPEIDAINILKADRIDRFSFKASEERLNTAEYSAPLSYLYEPNAAILKAGAFKTVARRFNVKKIHPHTHLYTSDEIHSRFPGRIFSVIAHVKPSSNSMKNVFVDGKANVTVRNYPLTVKQLRDKTGLKDGGDTYLIGFSGIERKYLVAAAKVS